MPPAGGRADLEFVPRAVAAAAAELGTTTKVATVHEALRLAAARKRAAAYLDLLAELGLDDTDRGHAWRAA